MAKHNDKPGKTGAGKNRGGAATAKMERIQLDGVESTVEVLDTFAVRRDLEAEPPVPRVKNKTET